MKYMGSKSRIKKDIVPVIQEYINKNNITKYLEPFVGGANIIDSIVCNEKVGNDKSEFLIEMFKAFTEDNSLIDDKRLSELTKEEYDECRSRFYKNDFDEKYPKWYVGAVGFLGSYNGRFFDGGYAKTLVSKTGSVRNYYQEAKRNLKSQLKDLNGIRWFNKDYMYFSNVKNAVIYCDPPYKDTKQYGTSKNFSHSEFWQWVREMSKNNIVIVSELQAPQDFICIWEQEVTRTQDNAKRTKSIERMFIYEKCEAI